MSRNYWGYRIDTNAIAFFRDELAQNRLRQGWGYDEGQDLRNLKVDQGARRNLAIFKKVKKGDILLVPRCPNWNEVAIVEATEDFNEGYRFSISEEYHDYGHCFPAKILKSFDRNNLNVDANIRATIKNVSRFWNVNHCALAIEKLINLPNSDLKSKISYENAFSNSVNFAFNDAFHHHNFADKLYVSILKKFSNEEWEYALVEGLKSYFPAPCIVERVGGINESNHGTDILITIPSILGSEYLIAIQVKDYSGKVNLDPIEQILKSDWFNQENRTVIDKIVIITKAKKSENAHLLENNKGVKVIFAEELKELLSKIAKSYLGLSI